DGSTGEGDDVETENVLGGLAGDTLTGDAKDNKLDGAAGDDTLDGRDGADQMIGGDGTDTATYATRAVNVNVWIDGQANDGGEADRQADNVTTSVENLIGSNGPDGLTGSDGANVLTGGPGQDTLDGGAGPDVLDGQAGVDTASYADRTARLSVTIDDNATDGADADGDGMGEEGDKVTTTVENIVGGSGPDRLAGGAADNRIDGRGGDDLLYGGASLNGESDGRDTLAGGEGNDTVSYAGRANADPVVVTLDGTANDGKADGSEKDNVVPDVENLVGGHGDDDLTGSNRPNRLSGGPFGDDVLHGEGGDDVFDEADDPQAAFADHDEYFGGEGNDTADYSRRTRSVAVTLDDNANDGYPASGDDAAENDNVHGDVETVLGSAQADFLWGSPDADRLFGNGGSDRIYGRGGDDDLVGADGVDRIFGDNGNDKITGGPGNNVLTGGYGDDQFVEAPTWVGNDGYNGGPGRDTVDYSARNVSVTVDNDNVSGDDGEDADFNGTAEEKDRVNKDVEVLKGGAKRDRLTNTQDTPDTCAALYGGGGDDLLTGGDAREALFGGDGSDTLNAGDDRDWLIGGNGSDLENGGDDNDTFVQGLLGISCKSWTLFEIAGGDGADRINGDGGTDQVIYRRSANSGVKVSLDGATNDGVVGEGDNVKTEEILGGSGNDTLIGDDKDNRISGFHGDDHIEGRGGDDTMVEFFGTDTILGEGGDDEIYADDKDNADTIDGGLDSDSGRWDDGDTVASMEDRN
ncbi:MAG TPA: calcium-binding protein, partial [Solirubrobacteraceae bacterium]